MKLKLFFIIILAFSATVRAQEKCMELENKLSEYINQQDYKKAYSIWSDIKLSCSKFNQNSYVLANQVLQYNVDSSTGDEKTQAIKELALFYDVFDKNFPENKNGNLVKKAMLLYDTKLGDDEQVFSLLHLALKKDTNQFTTPKPLYDYYYLLCERYKQKKSGFSEIFDDYIELFTILEANKAKFNNEEFATAKMAMTNLLQENLTVENLPSYIDSQFEAQKNNMNWLTNSGNLLMQKSPKSPILEKVALQIESIQPSYQSSIFLANYYLKNRKQTDAINYFEKAILNSQNPTEKAYTAYNTASIIMLQDPSKAKQLIDIAIENSPNEGKNYIFLATLYENSLAQCTFNKEEQAAVYQLASQTVLQAEKVEPRYKATAQKYSSDYLKKLNSIGKPKKKSVTLNCWINQTVQF